MNDEQAKELMCDEFVKTVIKSCAKTFPITSGEARIIAAAFNKGWEGCLEHQKSELCPFGCGVNRHSCHHHP